jgi:hypothetical protein
MEQKKKILVEECKNIIEHSSLFAPVDFLAVAEKIISQSPNYYEVGEIFSVIYMDLKEKTNQNQAK